VNNITSKTRRRERSDGTTSGRRSKPIFRWKSWFQTIHSRHFLLNEAWCHTLDEYVIDTPLNEVLLPLLRNCFFGGAIYALLLLQKGHGDQLACDIAGFMTEEPRS